MRHDTASGGSQGGNPAASGCEEDFLEVLRRTSLSELHTRLDSLTTQERNILEFIVRGQCNKTIGRALGIEITTAKVHASRIFKKLGVKNRVQAAVLQLWALLLSDQKTMTEPRSKLSITSDTDASSPIEPTLVLQCETQ